MLAARAAFLEVAVQRGQRRRVDADDVDRVIVKARELEIDDFIPNQIAEDVTQPVDLHQTICVPDQPHEL